MKHLLSTAIALLSAAIALPASAIEVYKDSSGAVYISGLQPSEFVKIAYGGLSQKINVRPTGTCNYLKLPYKASEPGFYPWNGVNVYPSGQATSVLTFTGNDLNQVDIVGQQLCANTERNTSLAWTALSGGAYGIRDADNQAVYIFGLPYKSYEAKDGLPAIRRQRANTCGFVRISDTAAWPAAQLQTFYFYANSYNGGTPSSDYAPATLPVQPAHLCRNGVLYSPA